MTADHLWYQSHPLRFLLLLLLLPLVALFYVLSRIRRWSYQHGLLEVKQFPVPVVIVGNITVGGTGKTPLVIWLARHLKSLGYRPGIVCRGYGGKAQSWPQAVAKDSDPRQVGDEAVLLAERTACPVWVGPDRPTAINALLKQSDCNLVISDDGLQHYAMARNLEILVIDGQRGFGNGYLLPAGPLRETAKRLTEVDLVISNGPWRGDVPQMDLGQVSVVDIEGTDLSSEPLSRFQGKKVHAVAGIGHPERFFTLLEQHGLELVRHPFADHHQFQAEDLGFQLELPILMTDKDGVKCRSLLHKNSWLVRIEVQPETDFVKQLNHLLEKLNHG